MIDMVTINNSISERFGGFLFANENNKIYLTNSLFLKISGVKGGGFANLYYNNSIILRNVKFVEIYT